jgi:hypothetical protein
MNVLLQAGGGGAGSLGGFAVSVVVVLGLPIAVLLVGRLVERLF